MKALINTENFGLIVGTNWTRWYIGAEFVSAENAHAMVFRLGPFYMHLVNRIAE